MIKLKQTELFIYDTDLVLKK